jgi:leucyl-tRNA synthetase
LFFYLVCFFVVVFFGMHNEASVPFFVAHRRDWSIRCNVPMHQDVVMRFIEAVVVMMAPITPHWCENAWSLLGKAGTVCDASWPSFQPCDRLVRKQYIFFRDFLKNLRLGTIKLKVAAPKHAVIYLTSTYEPAKIEVQIRLIYVLFVCSYC